MAIAHVQNNDAHGKVVSFDSANAAGNLLVCCISSGGNVTNVTDTAGNTWVKALDEDNAGLPLYSDLWYVESCNSGDNTVTLSGGYGGGYDEIWVGEFSGIVSSSSGDQAASTGSSVVYGQPDSGDVTISQADELLMGYVATTGDQSVAWDSPWDELFDSVAGGRNISVAHQIVASIDTYAATATIAAGSWQAAIATFKGAAAGGAVLQRSLLTLGCGC